MEILWMNAVIDVLADEFDAASQFWIGVTGSRAGEVHPEHDEFTVLHPPAGDSHLEVQRLVTGQAGVHLDLFVDDVGAAADEAVAAGATTVRQTGIAVMRTPGGFVFCLVPYRGERTLAPVIDVDRPHAVDQLCIDVPHASFIEDVEFWSRLTGWDINPQQAPATEFRSFDQPTTLPFRLLIQQLGLDDTGHARSHLDISAHGHVEELVQDHVDTHGAVVEAQHRYWTALRDPAGLPYCLTSRRPQRR